MNDATHIQDAADFAAATHVLRSLTIPAAFLMKSRILGAVLNTTFLRGNDWEFIPDPDGHFRPWQDCLWLRKSFHLDDREFIVHLATSGFVEPVPNERTMRFVKNDQFERFGEEFKPDRIESMFHTDDDALVFLRTIRFLAEDNGLVPCDLGNDVPDALIAELEEELDANIRDYWFYSLPPHLDHWTALADDLQFLTKGLNVEVPGAVLMPSKFVKQLEIVNALIFNGYRNQGEGAGRLIAERLLVRLVRVVAERGYAPDAEAELLEFPDGMALAHFLRFWFDGAPHDGAAAHLLAYVLERACSDLAVPCNSVSWRCISACFADFGFRKEAVLAAERAIAAPDADNLCAQFLWNAILDFLHGIPEDDINDEGRRLNLGWLIQILFSHESALGEFDHFNALLGLAMAANGNDCATALGIIEKEFDRKRQGDGTEEKPRMHSHPLNVRCPLAWQALFAIDAGLPVAVKRALAIFPKPLLSRHWGRFDIPERTIVGLSDAEFRYSVTSPPVMEDGEDGALIDISWTQYAKPVPPSGKWHYLHCPQAALGPDGVMIAHKLFSYREDDSEIVMLWARGAHSPDNPQDNRGFQRFIPLAKPNLTNAVVSVWEMLPYADGCLGEVRFRIGDDASLYAMMPYFCIDRDLIFRGEPVPSYIYGLGIAVEHAKEGEKAQTPDGDEIDLYRSHYFYALPDDGTMCVCKFHGEIKAVRTVKVAANGEALCVDLDVGKKLPFLLPLYTKAENVKDGPVHVGDFLDGLFSLQIDCFPPDANAKAWLAAHPDGAGEEPPEETGHHYPVSIRKRNADGERANKGELPPLDYVRMALERLEASYGCTAAVRLEPNPEGADIAARVHGLALKYHVVAIDDSVKESPRWDWKPGELMPLFVRVSDAGTQYRIDYLNFPLTERPVKSRSTPFSWLGEISRESIRYFLAEGITDIRGYDLENIVEFSADYGPDFLDEVLEKLEALGENVNWLAHQSDKEGFCAVMLNRDNEEICEIFAKHGVDLGFERSTPDPSSDIYELVTERKTIENMERVARKWHEGQLRKDGKTPYIEHPKAVAELVAKWGFEPECDGWVVAVAWGHDLIEETPPDKREEVEEDIFASVSGLVGEREKVIDAIHLLSRDKTVFPVKADYIRHVAETASQPVLAVKIADRISNTRDFLKLEGAGIEKARRYFEEGLPLFDHLGKTKYTSQLLPDGVEERIRAEIATVRRELEGIQCIK